MLKWGYDVMLIIAVQKADFSLKLEMLLCKKCYIKFVCVVFSLFAHNIVKCWVIGQI